MAYPFPGLAAALGFAYPKDTPPSFSCQSTTSDYTSLPNEPADTPYSGAETVPSQISSTFLPPGFSYRGDDNPYWSYIHLEV